jgi:hypothetical protein
VKVQIFNPHKSLHIANQQGLVELSQILVKTIDNGKEKRKEDEIRTLGVVSPYMNLVRD